MTLIMAVFHLGLPVPGSCYCGCWLIGMAYWGTKMPHGNHQVISYSQGFVAMT